MPVALANLYLARQRVQVEFQLGTFGRVSDLVNSAAGALLSGTRQLRSVVSPAGLEPWEAALAEIVVSLPATRLIEPIVEPSVDPATAGSLQRARVQLPAALDVEEWEVTGQLHLVDRVRWVDFLASVQGKFVPVTGAQVSIGGTPVRLESSFVLVNGSRITALCA